MQCLFCGKELALLKRLRGGGEFCSEAHRKEYQEQYEQLALARLLQAKPPTESQSAAKTPFNAPEPHRESLYTQEVSIPAPVATEDAPAYAIEAIEAPEPYQAAEESDPAPLAGFLREPLVPAVTTIEQAGVIELDGTWDRLAILPGFSAQADSADAQTRASSNSEGTLPPAPRVELTLSLQALEHHTRTSERGLELREFTGPAPVMELQMRPETGSQPAGAQDVMEIQMSPHPPQKAKPWLGVPRGFPLLPAELGDLARLDFATTGFAYSDGPAAVPEAVPEAAPQSPQHPDPAPELPMAAAPDATEPAPPELVTKALPVTLHGLAAPRGKLGQAFPSALAAASDVQIPPSATLPLRPVIVFGPAPAPVQAPAQARPPQPAAAPAQPKPAPPKPAQSVPAQSVPAQAKQPAQAAPVQPASVRPAPVQPAPVQPEERSRPSVVPAPKSVPIKRSAAVEASAPAKTQEKNIAKTPAPAPAPPAPKPRESADPSEMPSLRMEATESAWSKLSNNLKIGVAAALVVAVSGVAYLVTRGNGKTAPEAPAATTSTPAVATGLAISGGWIDDWANSARSRRHISLLSGSAKLSDYRLEFQAQIETKAIGWIFRGLNPRNYYVTKLEIVTPGLEPTVALVHFAVVDGQDENRVTVPLPMKVRVDTNYKIRFDAIGNHFTTWVQGQKIDEWTDSRFGSGGVGFFSERDEKAAMQGPVNVVPLIPKN